MQCPKCKFEQPSSAECASCGIIIEKFHQLQSREAAQSRPSQEPSIALERLLDKSEQLHIEQHARHWYEILLNWEQANQYAIKDNMRRNLGTIFEHSTGFLNALIRIFLGSHRPLDVKVVHFGTNDLALELKRKFFFLFSDLEVVTPEGRRMGSVHRRFGIIFKRYDLLDERGHVFAKIASPFWRLWTFPVFDPEGNPLAVITKKWSGLAREMFTDADNFTIDFGGHGWSLSQKAVLFAAALSIDFDFFENNHNN